VLPQLVKLTRAALDFLFPPKCLGCGKEGNLVCHVCYHQLTPIVNPICPHCGRPQASSILCPACTIWRSSIDCIRAPLRFEGLTREIVHNFKYNNLHTLAQPLAIILKDYLLKAPLPVDVIIPVPLHSRRLRERGYNQSALLARELSLLMNLSYNEDEVQRTRYILPQVRTHSAQERQANLKGAFNCSAFSNPGKAVLLIDDVATSGATLDACAQALKMAGSGPVFGLVLAREILKYNEHRR
jgi:ComF family protein